MHRVELRKFESTVLVPMRTGPGGEGGHVHSVPAGSTRTDPADPNEHTHEIRPGSDRTEPGGLDGHTHSVPSLMKQTYEPKREILDGEMFFLSLVDAGANMAEVVMKDARGQALQRIEAMAKFDEKEGLLYTLVYGPDLVDTHGDFAKKDAVKKLAHKFIPNMVGSGIDVMHNCKPVDPRDAHLCENLIIQKNGDDRFKGVKVNGRVIEDTSELDGWWASVIKLNAPALRAPFESGKWTGVSMYGNALVQPVLKQDDFTNALAARLGLNTNPPKETPMDETKLAQAIAAALTGSITPLVEKIDTLVKSVDDLKPKVDQTTVEAGKQDIPVFDGDPNDLEAVEAYEEELFRAKLDFSNEKDLAKWKAHLSKKAELVKQKSSSEAPELAKAKAEAEAAVRRVQEMQKASRQTPNDVNGTETDVERVARIRKNAKETAQAVLRSQGRIK